MRTHPPHTPVSQSARQELLLHNLPLVRSIVTKVQRERMSSSSSSHATSSTTSGGRGKVVGTSSSALTRDDLLHEGTIGLAEAIDRHDPKRDARLSTYATYWIRARIVRAVQCRGEHALLRFPERVVQASHRLARAAREMGLDWDDVVDMSIIVEDDYAGDRTRELKSRLCSRAGIPLAGNLFGDAVRVRSMSRSGYTTTPLESWMSSAASTHADAGDDVAMLDGSTTGVGQERHIVETLSKFLMPREVEVLSLRYGLVPPSSSEGEGDDNDEEEEVEGEDVMRRPVFRDYEAEAEEGLFGPSGMLSHYAVTPNEDGIIDKEKLGVDTSVSASAAKLNGNGDRFSSVAAAGATKIAAAVSAKSPSSSPMTSASRHAKETVMVTSPSSLPSTNSLLPFKEIGKRMKFSGEYCRRTCSVALNKLSRAVEEGRLVESDFLLGW
ncbi:hypothetical protein ACHAXA_009738 [Cyclostephanos tholiformis]|uniref:RNA polymerase sigma-70 region 2 domain-containing protein n=1 Tax=Cyclostephanos tholiformis TaxID=382380 RepID=A0ABD3R8Z4_9STRA